MSQEKWVNIKNAWIENIFWQDGYLHKLYWPLTFFNRILKRKQYFLSNKYTPATTNILTNKVKTLCEFYLILGLNKSVPESLKQKLFAPVI